jgi:hypothetical protein
MIVVFLAHDAFDALLTARSVSANAAQTPC